MRYAAGSGADDGRDGVVSDDGVVESAGTALLAPLRPTMNQATTAMTTNAINSQSQPSPVRLCSIRICAMVTPPRGRLPPEPCRKELHTEESCRGETGKREAGLAASR